MKILITGGAGFVGANLAVYFANKGHEIISMDNLVRRGSENALLRLKQNKVKFIHGDIRNKEDLVHLPKDINIILNTAGETTATNGYFNPEFDLRNNTIGVMNLLELARKNGAGLIQWSTNKVFSGDRLNAIKIVENETRLEVADKRYKYGIPEDFPVEGGEHSIYGLSKLMSDLMCQEYSKAFNVRTIVNRFSCLCGPYQWSKVTQGWFTYLAIAFHFKFPIQYLGWAGKQVRDILYIDDVAKLIEAQVGSIDSVSGETFNIGGGSEFTISLREATALLENMFGYSVPIEVLKEPRRADQGVYISDIRKAKNVLGWEPKVTPKEAYSKIVSWIKNDSHLLAHLYDLK